MQIFKNFMRTTFSQIRDMLVIESFTIKRTISKNIQISWNITLKMFNRFFSIIIGCFRVFENYLQSQFLDVTD